MSDLVSGGRGTSGEDGVGGAVTALRQQRRERVLGLSFRLLALVALLVAFGIIAPGFVSRANWLNISTFATITLILGVGETFVIITAGIDLSVGANLGVASSVAALILHSSNGGTGVTVLAIVAALVAGAAFGLINGSLIVGLGVSPFIVTLGTLGIGTGITDLLTNGSDITVPPALSTLGNGVIGGWLPVSVLIVVCAAVVAHVYLTHTRAGCNVFATGSNPQAARRSGIAVGRSTVSVYVIAGLCAGIAAVLTVGQFSVGSPTAGQNDELNAIAAVVIGGASLFGGVGTVGGTVIGAVFVSAMTTGLVLDGTQPYWQTIMVGVLIVAAVAVQQGRESLRRLRITIAARFIRARR